LGAAAAATMRFDRSIQKNELRINILNPSTIQNFSLKLLLLGIAPSLFKIIIPRRKAAVRSPEAKLFPEISESEAIDAGCP
jgi:hypothetical protein